MSKSSQTFGDKGDFLMKKINLFLIITLALIGFSIAAPKNVKAGGVCETSNCYIFDSLLRVSASNLTFNGVSIIGLVAGVEKTVHFFLDTGGDPIQTEALNHCLKNALLAQVSPDKFQLVIQSNQPESGNSLTFNPPGTASYICSLVSK
jgi:hypothetical protein